MASRQSVPNRMSPEIHPAGLDLKTRKRWARRLEEHQITLAGHRLMLVQLGVACINSGLLRAQQTSTTMVHSPWSGEHHQRTEWNWKHGKAWNHKTHTLHKSWVKHSCRNKPGAAKSSQDTPNFQSSITRHETEDRSEWRGIWYLSGLGAQVRLFFAVASMIPN